MRSWQFDPSILAIALTIIGVGLVMVYSSSVAVADHLTGKPYFFLERQGVFTLVSLIAAALMFQVPMTEWQRLGPWLMGVGALLLVVVLLVGRDVNGSTRWIPLGSFNLQVSEMVKLAVVVYMAGYLVRQRERVLHRIGGFAAPMALLGVLVVLLMLEPDFGAAVVMLATAMGMMFLAGARIWLFLAVLLPGVMVLAVMVYGSEYRMRRMAGFLDPWQDPTGTGYQLIQALIAFGRGEWFGAGLGDSVQKFFYLPEAHTDFVFSIVAEELGLMGTWGVIVLFALLISRGFDVAKRAERAGLAFHTHIAHGITLWLAIQSIINIGVNMGALPTKGLTLPFMSYGGSSLLSNCVALALLLRVDHEARGALGKAGRGPTEVNA